jgi:hypothetical protein
MKRIHCILRVAAVALPMTLGGAAFAQAGPRPSALDTSNAAGMRPARKTAPPCAPAEDQVKCPPMRSPLPSGNDASSDTESVPKPSSQPGAGEVERPGSPVVPR